MDTLLSGVAFDEDWYLADFGASGMTLRVELTNTSPAGSLSISFFEYDEHDELRKEITDAMLKDGGYEMTGGGTQQVYAKV